jgi:hypothetical protein
MSSQNSALNTAGSTAVEVDQTRKICFWIFRGVITVDVLVESFKAREKHPDFSYDLDVVADFTDADLDQYDFVEIEKYMVIAAGQQKKNGRYVRRCAIIIDDPRRRAIFAFFENVAKDGLKSEEALFSTREEAEAWIDRRRRECGEV